MTTPIPIAPQQRRAAWLHTYSEAVEGRVMRGDRDGLLDQWVQSQARLFQAQTILLDTYALLDDLAEVVDGEIGQRVISHLTATGHFLESVPWARDPNEDHFPDLLVAEKTMP